MKFVKSFYSRVSFFGFLAVVVLLGTGKAHALTCAEVMSHLDAKGIEFLIPLNPGDLVSFTIRDPIENDPAYEGHQVEVFSGIRMLGTVSPRLAANFSGLLVPADLLKGPVTVINPGDLVAFTVRDPINDDPAFEDHRTEVFSGTKIFGKAKSVPMADFSGLLVPTKLLKKVTVIKSKK